MSPARIRAQSQGEAGFRPGQKPGHNEKGPAAGANRNRPDNGFVEIPNMIDWRSWRKRGSYARRLTMPSRLRAVAG
jgi:hypothetical protein